MCSIFGWIPTTHYRDAGVVQEAARVVAESMAARGPNDRGWHIYLADRTVATESAPRAGMAQLLLGQTRLSIIDLSSAGHQPMSTPDGRYTIVYNGEVYNYRELREELRPQLEERGHQFVSNTDTEVLLWALVLWGTEALRRCHGMFAFALYDRQAQTVLLARDFFGIKPLYYQASTNGLSFASELPSLLLFPGTARRLNAQMGYEYLAFGDTDHHPDTMVENVHHLPPAHYCRIDVAHGTITECRRYWQIDLAQRSELSFEAAAERLRELFLQSVRLQLRSDVPLGIALSGGIDSSAVACAVRHVYPDHPINTFSYVARDSAELTEELWIDLVNAQVGAIAHKVHVQGEELFDDLDRLILRLGEPFGSTSIYAQFRVFRLVRESGVTVTLDGQGADELLGGYHRYSTDRLETLLRSGRLTAAAGFLRHTGQWPGRSAREIAIQTTGRFVPSALRRAARAMIGRTDYPAWLDRTFLHDHQIDIRPPRGEGLYRSPDKLRQILATESTEYQLAKLLRHGDRNAMTWSVESRVPFCNPQIAEFVLSLPEQYLIDDHGTTKAVFRAAMRGIVPDAILDRRDKIGFQTPEQRWFPRMVRWVEPIVAAIPADGPLDRAAVQRAWAAVESGHGTFSGVQWRQINYLRWCELLGITL